MKEYIAGPTVAELRESGRMDGCWTEQVRAMCEDMGEDAGMRKARGVAAAYMKHLRGAAALRHQAHSLSHYTDLAGLIYTAYEQNREEH